MDDKIMSLTLPLVALPLRHAAIMLNGMADELEGKVAPTAPAAPPAPTIDPDAGDEGTAFADTLAAGGDAGAADLAAGEDPPPPPAGVELDEAGLPWDIRINPDSKGKLKTGARKDCWKYKKKLEPAYIVEVETELRANLAASPPAAAVAGDGKTAPAPPAPAATTETTEAGVMDFQALIVKVTALQGAGKITGDQLTGIAAMSGLTSFPLVANRPDLIPAINAEIDKLCPPTP